ncbi:hypothetical protein AB6F89_09310 [Providencia hangzhouensis]|uniref:hypothetical protein n=1 Tax=Providencia hangzhouensis TaxID=3031799 RepID=UPI0034DCF244
MSSTFNKNQISLANIDSKNIFKEIDYSTILSVSKKPPTNTIYLEKTYQSVINNLDKNSTAICHLLAKIDKLKHKFKIEGSDEWSDLNQIESMLHEQDKNQEKISKNYKNYIVNIQISKAIIRSLKIQNLFFSINPI